MRRTLALAAIGSLCVALSVNVPGCTVIFGAIGASRDAANSTGGPARLLRVKVGRSVKLLLWDSTTVEGRFVGWSRDSAVPIASTDIGSPRGAKVRLATKHGEVAVATESIAEVRVSAHEGMITGTLLGLAIDAIVIASVRQAARGPSCEGPVLPNGSFGDRVAPVRTAPRSGGP